MEVEEAVLVLASPILAASRLVCQRQCQEAVQRDGARVAEGGMMTAEVAIGYTAVEEAGGGERSCCSVTAAVEVECIAGADCP